MDLSEYRLNHPSEINKYKDEMGEKKFYDYAISIYKYFANMTSGSRFDITKRVKNHPKALFVKITCLYMIDFPNQLQVNKSFTNILKI